MTQVYHPPDSSESRPAGRTASDASGSTNAADPALDRPRSPAAQQEEPPFEARLTPSTVAFVAAAQSALDGTWKAETGAARFGGKPQSRTLKNGSYTCGPCVPAYTASADGSYQPIRGNPYFDAVGVTVVDPSTVRFAYRKAGKATDEDTVTVSPDGRTATWRGVDRSAANGPPVEYDVHDTRVDAAPAGAQAISGSWMAESGGQASDDALTRTMKTPGDAMTISYPTGESVTARFGGPAATVAGDPGKSMVKLVRTGSSSLTSTMTRDGETMSIATAQVSPDGRTLTYRSENKRNGATSQFTATRPVGMTDRTGQDAAVSVSCRNNADPGGYAVAAAAMEALAAERHGYRGIDGARGADRYGAYEVWVATVSWSCAWTRG